MCGASFHVACTFSSQRSTLRLFLYDKETLSSSCHSFVTRSTVSWPRDTQIHGMCKIEEVP